MKRAVAATVATAGGLAALLSYKSGTPSKRLSTADAPSTSTSTSPSSPGAAPATTSPAPSVDPSQTEAPGTSTPPVLSTPTTTDPPSTTSTTQRPATTTTAVPIPTTTTAPATGSAASGRYTDGNFTGPDAPNRYGDVQVQAVVKNGHLTDVIALQLPQDRARSQQISEYSAPILHDEAIQSQSAQIDTVSGATYTSRGYIESLQAALDAARRG